MGSLSNQLFNRGKHPGDDLVYSLGGWVHAILLIKVPVSRHAVEKEGIKRCPMFLSQSGENGVEVCRILRPEIRWCPHAGDEDGKLEPVEFGENLIERRLGSGRRQSPEGVIGAKFDDHRRYTGSQGPVEAG